MIDIKNIVLGIAIFILTLSVGIYGINTFYGGQPKYDEHCPSIITEEQCINAGGKWINNTRNVNQEIIETMGKPIQADIGYCVYDYNKCQKEYNTAREKYSKGTFMISLPLGIIIIAIGALIFGLASVGGGLMAGGVGIIIYGVVQFWEFAVDWLKFVLSLVGLVLVIALAYYANKKWFKESY